jgi:CRISPR/Cas system-associated exonuclease Cas4 (RecB family)
MATPLVLSGSSINTYLRCPKQWEYAYVKAIKQPPTLRLAIGSAAHTAIEYDLTQKLETGVDQSLEQLQDTFRDEFEVESYGAEDEPKETKGQALDSGIKSVATWHADVAPDTHPLAVEQEIQFSINGIVVNGTIDVVKQVGFSTIIGDWKFVGKKPSSAGLYLLNLVGYVIGWREKTKQVEDGVVLDHIVRTKQPYHFPIEGGTIPDESISAYAGIVEQVAHGIQTDNFPPTGLQSNACSWCGYRDICPAFRAASM